MTGESIIIEFEDKLTLRREFESNLIGGGTFIVGVSDLRVDETCEIELVHPITDDRLGFTARVVWVAPPGQAAGVGVALEGFDPDRREQLREFAYRESTQDENPEEDAAGAEDAARAESVHDRLRGLTVVQQVAMARTGEINERVVLERIYGKTVWEALLRNPKVTVAEVSRIAKMGNLPRPLVEQIISNNKWLASGQVRRAILTNPRITPDGINKVLRAVPRAELKLIPKQTVYPIAIRAAAKKLLF